MTDYRTSIGGVVYNPATQAFEATVTFHEGGDTIRVPCALRLPIDSEPQTVIDALLRQARIKRHAEREPLVSRLNAMDDTVARTLAGRIAAAAERHAA